MRTIFISLCLLVLFASGCAGKRSLGGSFVGELPEGVAVDVIAADVSAQIAELYPPGHTNLFILAPEKEADNDFSHAFESALRQSGFTVLSSLPAENSVTVAYVLDQLNWEKDGERVWYLLLRLSSNEKGGMAFARTYLASGKPESARSKTDIVFSRPLAFRVADKATRKVGKVYDRSVEYLME